jgi:hypothetical protein
MIVADCGLLWHTGCGLWTLEPSHSKTSPVALPCCHKTSRPKLDAASATTSLTVSQRAAIAAYLRRQISIRDALLFSRFFSALKAEHRLFQALEREMSVLRWKGMCQRHNSSRPAKAATTTAAWHKRFGSNALVLYTPTSSRSIPAMQNVWNTPTSSRSIPTMQNVWNSLGCSSVLHSRHKRVGAVSQHSTLHSSSQLVRKTVIGVMKWLVLSLAHLYHATTYTMDPFFRFGVPNVVCANPSKRPRSSNRTS